MWLKTLSRSLCVHLGSHGPPTPPVWPVQSCSGNGESEYLKTVVSLELSGYGMKERREAMVSQRDSLQEAWAMSTPGYLCPSYCAPGVTVPDFISFQDSPLSSLLRCYLCYKALLREPGSRHSQLLPSLRSCPN